MDFLKTCSFSRKFIEHQVFGTTNLHHLQAIALALHHAGVDWEGEFPSAWKEMKSKTPFGELPVLEAPAVRELFMSDVEATHGRPKFGVLGLVLFGVSAW